MRICPNCASENADTALFCVSCGNSLKNSRTKRIPVRKIAEINDAYERQKTAELFNDPEKSFDEIDEELAFERQITRYRQEQGRIGSEESRRGRGEDRKIMLIGVIGILAVLVCGILAFNALSGVFAGYGGQSTSSAKLSDDMIRELTREKEAETDLPVSDNVPDAQEEKEEKAEKSEKSTTVSASLMMASDLDHKGYSRVVITEAKASSVIDQPGFDNSPIRAADGNESTSWQEGVKGPGIGETVEYTLDRSYRIQSITFKLGNWSSETYYWRNNRPKTMTIWLDDAGFEVTFPDGMTEYAVAFAENVQASEMHLEINSVYKGSTYDDTCISDIGIYGK